MAETAFANLTNIWTGTPVKPPKKVGSGGTDTARAGKCGKPRADIASMRVEFDTPLPLGRARIADGMYSELLATMKPKGCIVCKPNEVYAVASAMRSWIKRQGKDAVWSVRTELRSDKDGKGRVWCWPEPPPFKAKRGAK